MVHGLRPRRVASSTSCAASQSMLCRGASLSARLPRDEVLALPQALAGLLPAPRAIAREPLYTASIVIALVPNSRASAHVEPRGRACPARLPLLVLTRRRGSRQACLPPWPCNAASLIFRRVARNSTCRRWPTHTPRFVLGFRFYSSRAPDTPARPLPLAGFFMKLTNPLIPE